MLCPQLLLDLGPIEFSSTWALSMWHCPHQALPATLMPAHPALLHPWFLTQGGSFDLGLDELFQHLSSLCAGILKLTLMEVL